MPYKKSTRSKSHAKKKSYSRRFNDSRINTKIERKIQEIARKEDRKNEEWIVCKNYITANGAWDSTIERPDNPQNIAANTVRYAFLSDCADQVMAAHIYTPAPLAPTNTVNSRYVQVSVRQIQCRLHFMNTTNSSVRVRAVLLWMPNVNSQTAAAVDGLLPTIYDLGRSPNGKYSGMFSHNNMLKNSASSTNSANKMTIIDAKDITLPAPKLFSLEDDPVALNNAYTIKPVVLNQTYKRYKKLFANPPLNAITPSLFANGNYAVAYCHDSPVSVGAVQVYGIGGIKLKVDGLSGYQLIGDPG